MIFNDPFEGENEWINFLCVRERLVDMSLLPVNISDQSVGFICSKKLNEAGLVNIYYALSLSIHGHSIIPWFDANFKLDFEDVFLIKGGLVINQSELEKSIKFDVYSNI